jgi:hypothetical protein
MLSPAEEDAKHQQPWLAEILLFQQPDPSLVGELLRLPQQHQALHLQFLLLLLLLGCSTVCRQWFPVCLHPLLLPHLPPNQTECNPRLHHQWHQPLLHNQGRKQGVDSVV